MLNVLYFILGLVLVLFVLKIFGKPIKFLIKIAINTFLGGIVLLIINTLGAGFKIAIGINYLTALIVGILGLPGVILLILLSLI